MAKSFIIGIFYLVAIASALATSLPRTPCSEHTIKNSSAEATVCVAHGRIKSFRLLDKENVLWVNDGDLKAKYLPHWKNYGGDKIWIAMPHMRQNLFGRGIPDPYIDGESFELVSKDELSITFQSQLSPTLGARLIRTLTLATDKPVLTIQNIVAKEVANPYPLQIWQVTQVAKGEHAYVKLTEKKFSGMVKYVKTRNALSKISIEKLDDLNLKLTLPIDDWDNFIAWVESFYIENNGTIFRQKIDYVENEPYHIVANCQIYTNEFYTELESFSPLFYLKAGEKYANTIIWELEKNE